LCPVLHFYDEILTGVCLAIDVVHNDA
jgi:hypothetical protein